MIQILAVTRILVAIQTIMTAKIMTTKMVAMELVLQAILVSNPTLTQIVSNTCIAGTAKRQVLQSHVPRVHSSMTASSSAIGKSRLHVRRPQAIPLQVIPAIQLLQLLAQQASLVSKLSLAL